jgi:hypothetical protein
MHLNEGYLRIIGHFCPKVSHSTLHSPKVIFKLYIGYVNYMQTTPKLCRVTLRLCMVMYLTLEIHN